MWGVKKGQVNNNILAEKNNTGNNRDDLDFFSSLKTPPLGSMASVIGSYLNTSLKWFSLIIS